MGRIIPEADAPTRPMRSGRGRSLRLITPETGSKHIDVHISVLEPNSGAGPLHYHTGSEEVMYVLSGTMRVVVGDETRIAGPGTTVFVAAGERHAADNAGDGELRILEVRVPQEADFVIVPAEGRPSTHGPAAR